MARAKPAQRGKVEVCYRKLALPIAMRSQRATSPPAADAKRQAEEAERREAEMDAGILRLRARLPPEQEA